MRRSARALSAVVLAGAALGLSVPAAFAEPAAEVSPGSLSPGESVTVSVSCDPAGGREPATIDARSEAFETGTVTLSLVPGDGDAVSGPAYHGTARIAPEGDIEGAAEAVAAGDVAWTVDGTCPAASSGGQGKQWSARFTVSRGSAKPCAPAQGTPCATGTPCTDQHTESCGGAAVQRGVRAGAGGAFSDSVPVLVAGGLLIAGALGAAAHRLVHRLVRRKPAGHA